MLDVVYYFGLELDLWSLEQKANGVNDSRMVALANGYGGWLIQELFFFFFVLFFFLTIRGIRGIHSEGGDGYVLYSVQRTTYEIPPTH